MILDPSRHIMVDKVNMVTKMDRLDMVDMVDKVVGVDMVNKVDIDLV